MSEKQKQHMFERTVNINRTDCKTYELDQTEHWTFSFV